MTQSYLIGRRNVHDSPWTAERDAVLAKLWGEGCSASQIAEAIRDVVVSRCAVIGRAHRLKLPPRQERKRQIRPDSRRPRQFVPKPPAPPPRPDPPPPPPGAPKMRKLTLIHLKPHHCRWPIEDSPTFLFCAADAADGAVYCPFHQRMARVREKAK